jgi:SPP1 gp7 family putative phage head morphogenesis protein
MKKIIKDQSLSFKNTRLETTVNSETSRVTNELRDFMMSKAGLEKKKFTSVLDKNTSDFCRGHDGNIYLISEGPSLPAHPNCRSYYLPVPN